MSPDGVWRLAFTGTRYGIGSSPLTSITPNGVVIIGIFGGTCASPLTGAYDPSTGIVTFRQAMIPTTAGSNPCRVAGRIQLSPTVTFTIP